MATKEPAKANKVIAKYQLKTVSLLIRRLVNMEWLCKMLSATRNLFPERLVARRETLKMTRADLARRLHTSDAQIWRYETGKNDPTTKVLYLLHEELNCSVDWLLGISEEMEVLNPKQWTPVVMIPLPGGRKIDVGHKIDKIDDIEIEAIEILRSKRPDRRLEVLEILRRL